MRQQIIGKATTVSLPKSKEMVTTPRQRRPGYSSQAVVTTKVIRRIKKGSNSDSSAVVLLFVCAAVFLLFAPVALLKWGLAAREEKGLRLHHAQGEEEDKNTKYHVVFSTDCSDNHNWQSYVLFYHANLINQPGTITRIASGCTAKEEMSMEDFHFHHIESISKRFKIHFTPSYTKIDGDEFPYFNKPFGLVHWMEHVLGFPAHADDEDAVVILLDPDMIPLRPITRHFDNATDRWKGESIDQVTHGQPVAQQYLLAPQWRKWNLTEIVGHDSPALSITRQEALAHYQLGPPYIATARDMWKIGKRWTELCLPVKKQYPFMLAEMFAYILAAADVGLPHAISYSLMWSDPKVQYTEPWDWVESLPVADMCVKMPDKVPNVLHYCQPYDFNGYELYKYELKGKIHRCSSPLIEEPPDDFVINYDLKKVHTILTMRKPEKQVEWAERANKREAFAVCHGIKKINEAMAHHRRNVCKNGGNTAKSIRMKSQFAALQAFS